MPEKHQHDDLSENFGCPFVGFVLRNSVLSVLGMIRKKDLRCTFRERASELFQFGAGASNPRPSGRGPCLDRVRGARQERSIGTDSAGVCSFLLEGQRCMKMKPVLF